jgi:alkylhydroperoxidase family enzyme
VLANNPTVLNVVTAQIQALIRKNSLPHRLRELIIMRIGWVTGSTYELTSLWRICMELGILLEDGVMAWPPDSVRPANAEG